MTSTAWTTTMMIVSAAIRMCHANGILYFFHYKDSERCGCEEADKRDDPKDNGNRQAEYCGGRQQSKHIGQVIFLGR